MPAAEQRVVALPVAAHRPLLFALFPRGGDDRVELHKDLDHGGLLVGRTPVASATIGARRRPFHGCGGNPRPRPLWPTTAANRQSDLRLPSPRTNGGGSDECFDQQRCRVRPQRARVAGRRRRAGEGGQPGPGPRRGRQPGGGRRRPPHRLRVLLGAAARRVRPFPGHRRLVRALGRVRHAGQRRAATADHAGGHRGGPLQPRLPVATPGRAGRHLRGPDVRRVGGGRRQRGVPGDPGAPPRGCGWRPRGGQLLLPRAP